MKKQLTVKTVIYHIIVLSIALAMLYPLAWMFMSSFKDSNTIFTTAGNLIPEHATLENYKNGLKGFAGTSFLKYFENSLFISITATLGTLVSSAMVAFAFSRTKFRGQKLLFGAVMATMLIPGQILMVPQYLWYQKLGWVGSYLPLIIPYCFATQGFFIYLFKNFMDGIPKELDEAAEIDGCSYGRIFLQVILPLAKPALVTGAIFSFMWRWDDYMSALLYISDVKLYPASLALKLFSDPGAGSDYGAMFAMATLSLIPIVLIFLFFQKYLVDGIATSGLKG